MNVAIDSNVCLHASSPLSLNRFHVTLAARMYGLPYRANMVGLRTKGAHETHLSRCTRICNISREKTKCCNVSITSLPIEISNHTFNATNKALSAAGETGLHGYQLNTTVNADDQLIHLELTAPLSISAVPGEAQKEPNNLKNGYYQGPESNRPEGHCRSPQE